MNIKKTNVYVRETEKMEELDNCLSRFGEVSSEGKKYHRRIFLTRDDLPICNAKDLIKMINNDLSKLELSNLKIVVKNYYFHFQSAQKDRNGEIIPYIDIEFERSYDRNSQAHKQPITDKASHYSD